MKKVVALCLAFSLILQSFAASAPIPPKDANSIFLSIGTKGQQISLLALSQIDIKSFETLSGRHLRFADKIGFKIAQRELRKSIRQDGTNDNKKLNRYMRGEYSSGSGIAGFALGFFVGLIGVLIAYLIRDDNKPNRTKWAWIGFGVALVLTLALYASIGVI